MKIEKRKASAKVNTEGAKNWIHILRKKNSVLKM